VRACPEFSGRKILAKKPKAWQFCPKGQNSSPDFRRKSGSQSRPFGFLQLLLMTFPDFPDQHL